LKLLKISATTVWDGELMISFDGTDLHFVTQGMKTRIAGQGHWPGTARVAAKYFIPLIKLPPNEEPITLRVKDGKLRIETYSISCRWQTTVPMPIDLPLDAPPIEILRLRFKYSLDDLAGAGLLPKLGELENDIARLYDEALRKRSQ
jgi:hypothetical protein